MAYVMDTGFCYFYAMSFVFIFYNIFITKNIKFMKRGDLYEKADFQFMYIITIAMIITH